jgi:hypothetical protein
MTFLTLTKLKVRHELFETVLDTLFGLMENNFLGILVFSLPRIRHTVWRMADEVFDIF